jgi:alginate O-acetyltransferase complex protein AlgI
MDLILAWLEGFVPTLWGAPATPLVFDTGRFAAFFMVLLALAAGVGQRAKARLGLLLGASLYVFAHFSGVWALLPCGLALADWAIARKMFAAQGARRNAWLVLSLVLNLGTLAAFKYTWFVLGAWQEAVSGDALSVAAWVAPVGLSFTTFRSLSYMLDVHREWADAPEENPLRYLAYVIFFPTLLAGPISRTDEMLPRLAKPEALSREQTGRAVWLFAKGLFKKVVIADVLGVNFVNRVFETPGAFTGTENLLAAFGYGVQLYADFSGYTDMALACALALGFELKGNFRRPFAATSIGDFWRRWHQTLSQWFADYVFTPLSISWRALGRWGAVLAVIVTFLLSGLWHGAGWTFILWGLSHGLAIAFETAVLPMRTHLRRNLAGWYYTPMSVLLCLSYLTLTFVLFRSANLASAAVMYGQIFGQGFSLDLFGQWLGLYRGPALVLGLGLALHMVPTPQKDRLERGFVVLPWWVQAVALAVVVLVTYQARTAELQPFIYLQF